MRIKQSAIVWTIAVLLSGAAAWGQEQLGIPSEDVTSGKKIGFLQFALVLEGTEEAKIEIGKVRTFMEGRQQDYNSKLQELESLKQQYREQERTLNADTRAEMQRTIQENERTLRRMQEDIQSEIDTRRDALFTRLSGKVQVILNDFAQANGYGAILFVDQLQGYFDPSLDVSQEIIRLYNAAHPVTAATP